MHFFTPKLLIITKKIMKTFEELGVNEEIRRAIEEMGFEHPMPVQEEVIPYLLGTRNDVIALAQTGTGKTAAFGIPLLQRIDTRIQQTQAIVLSPTRELCLQIADDLKDFSKYIPDIRRSKYRDTDTPAEKGRSHHCGNARTTHRPDEPRCGKARGGVQRGAR